ncbi:MAG: hypothetical protein L3J31_01500 [Bacteroidales bacterium]|nr:hypothetical protein [Bacteroidales bacterium]
MTKYLAFVLLVTVPASCNNHRIIESEDFSRYLENEWQCGMMKDGLYIIIPIYSCSGCIEAVVNQLSENSNGSERIEIIVLATTKRELNEVSQLLDAYTIHKGNYNSFYSTFKIEQNHPCIIQVKNSRLVNINIINPSKNLEESLALIASYQ